MSSELQDLGKQLVVNVEPGCWVSSLGQLQFTLRGDVSKIERTLELALIALRQGRTG